MRHASLTSTLLVPAAVAAVTGGTVLAAAGPAAARRAAPACTVNWVGGGPKVLWNIAQNWSTGKVPGPTSDVCMSPFSIVTATGPISIHSLHVGSEMTVVFQGTASHPSHVTVATEVHNLGNIELDNSSLTVPRFTNSNGLEAQGTSVLTTPALANAGIVDSLAGSLKLTDGLAQLRNGTLTGGTWDALDNGRLVLPGDITKLASGEVAVGTGSEIGDPAGNNALTGLTSVGAGATFAFAGTSLTLAGSLVSAGTVDVGNYASASTLAVNGTLTQTAGNLSLVSESTVSASTVRIDHGAGLGALGTIDGNLVSDGAVGPAYHLMVTGNYTQGADGSLAAGFVPELQVAGHATLAGTLIAGEAPPPQPGARGTAITFASVSGNFMAHNLGFNLVRMAHEIDVVAQPQIAVAPATVAPGGTVLITGGDFGLGTTVTFFLDHTNGTVLGSTRPSDQGAITTTASIGWIPAGTHTIIAVGSDGRQAQATITVS